MSSALVKLALLFQYMRVFKEELRMRRLSQGVAIFTLIWGLAYTFMGWFPCFPIYGYWTWTIKAKCYGFGSVNPSVFFGTYASASVMNMVQDMVILAIPFPLFFRKDTTSRTRMGLLGLFAMGAL
jgi:hypothetical protein